MGPPPRYTVITHKGDSQEDLADFLARASELIERGMVPAGGVACAPVTKGSEVSLILVQAFYRQPAESIEKMA
jgi:hypothetical protein